MMDQILKPGDPCPCCGSRGTIPVPGSGTLENADRLYRALYGVEARRLHDDGGTYGEKCN